MLRIIVTSVLPKCLLVVVAAGFFWSAGVCFAGKEQVPLPAHYPREFSVVDCIERIGADEVLMGDSVYKFARRATFHTPESSEPVSRARFREGRRVGLLINSKYEIESMWYLDNCR